MTWTAEELAEAAGTGLDVTTTGIKEILQKSFENLDEKLIQVNLFTSKLGKVINYYFILNKISQTKLPSLLGVMKNSCGLTL